MATEVEARDDLPTLVSALQASTVEWTATGLGAGAAAGARSRHLRYMQVLHEIDTLFAARRVGPSAALVSWCASLQASRVATHFAGLLVDHVLQGVLPYVALVRCLRMLDVFLSWTTRPNAGCTELTASPATAHSSCPVLIASYEVAKWVERTWAAVTSLARDTAGSSTATAMASLCGALQLLPVLLRWHQTGSPLPAFRRSQLPHSLNMVSLEARLLAFRALPAILQHQPGAHGAQACSYEVMEYVKRGCNRGGDMIVRMTAACSLRMLMEAGLHVPTPGAAYALMDALLALCDDASVFDVADEELHDLGVAMGYLLALYQSDFTVDCVTDVLLCVAASSSKAPGEERGGHRGSGTGGGVGSLSGGGGVSSGAGSGAGPQVGQRGVSWQYFGGSDAVEGSRVVQRCFNERMTRGAQRALATALATLCSRCATPATTADAIRCCFVLLVPFAEDARAYMPRLLADAMLEWAAQLPSNGFRVVLADALRGYVQRSGEDRAVARTAMVALKGVVRTVASSLEIGFNVADDVLAAVKTTPSLLHTGVEVLGAVARTNLLYARHLQHQCARIDSADVANTLTFQLHMRALLDAAAVRHRGDGAAREDGLGEADRVSLVHVCLRLLLRLSRGDPPRAVHDIHYRQAELIFRLTELLYDLLRGSTAAVLGAIRDELQPCTLGFMNLLVSSPAPTIAYYKAVTAACVMLRRAPLVSDTERMLAVGLLEARLASHYNGARAHGAASPTTATSSAAAAAYFAVCRGAVFDLVASRPWLTCRDDGSLRWLAGQAMKDIAAACAQGLPVLSFAEVYGAAVGSAAQSMRLVRSDLLPCTTADETTGGVSSAAAETPTRPVEECGGHAVRLLCWTLRHFLQRGPAAIDVCVALLASVKTDLFDVFAAASDATATATAAESAEEEARRALRRDTALWNCLCTVAQLLREAVPGAMPATAAGLWEHEVWKAEVKRWQTLAASLVPVAARTAVEVRLIAARVLGQCLVCTGQADAHTSQTVSAVAQELVGKSQVYDVVGALMVLGEVHSCHHEAAAAGNGAGAGRCEAAAAAEGGGEASIESCPTLPLATSLLAEAWKQLGGSAPTAMTSTPAAAPLLVLVSLRLAHAYPAEVEAALSDGLAAVVLSPMAATNRLWWSPPSALGMLTAVQQLWAAFPGACGMSSLAVRHGTALALLQESFAVVLHGQRAVAPLAAVAALDAVCAFTRKGSAACSPSSPVTARDAACWPLLLRLCLEYVTAEDAAAPLRRRTARADAVSRRLATLWLKSIEGASCGSEALRCTGAHLLSPVDVAVQVDVAVTAATRRAWVAVGQSVYTALFAGTGTPDAAPHALSALLPYVRGLHTVLQARSPDVQVDIAKRDADMFAAVEDGDTSDGGRAGGGSDAEGAEEYAAEYADEGLGGGILSDAGAANGGPASAEVGGREGGGAPTAAAALTFDIAAKEAAMWLMYGVVHTLGSPALTAAAADTPGMAEVRGELLPMVVAAVQLVEMHPEVQTCTIAVLHEVLVVWGTRAQSKGAACPAPVLLPWKTQLVVGLTTVLQHGLLTLEGCTALAVQYSRCNLADASSCRRVLRSLLLLLHACHRLTERRRGFLLTGGGGSGHVIVALAKVTHDSASQAGFGSGADAPSPSRQPAVVADSSQLSLLHALTTPPCQAALTLLCERFITATSLANGYVQAAGTLGLGWRAGGGRGGDDGDDDEDGASATSSVYGARMSVSAGDVLQAVVLLTQGPLSAVLGPALRYAAGCLAVLVLSTLPLAPPTDAASAPLDGNALACVVALSSKLTVHHQRLLAQLAQEKLQGCLSSSAVSASPSAAALRPTVTALLRVVAAVPIAHDAAAALLERVQPALKEGADVAPAWRTEAAASLLCIGLTADITQSSLTPLLAHVSAESLVTALPRDVVAQLHRAVHAYRRRAGPAEVRALALTSPAALLLVERGAADGGVGGDALQSRSVLSDRAAWPLLLQLLAEARDPLRTVQHLFGVEDSAASSIDGSSGNNSTSAPAAPASLRACVPRHRAQAEVVLAVLSALGGGEDAAVVVLRCGPLLCELLLGWTADAAGPASTAAEAIAVVLRYVVQALATPLAVAFAVALRPVGQHLLRVVAPSAGAALREAIRGLGSAKALQLRAFMESSCA